MPSDGSTAATAARAGPKAWTVLQAGSQQAHPPAADSQPLTPLRGVISPSILAADFSRLADEVAACLASGAQWVHVDVFDGSELCRGNLTLGPPVVQSLRQALQHAYLDCHLAVDDPCKYVRPLARAGASQITFHLDAPGLLSPTTHHALKTFDARLLDLPPPSTSGDAALGNGHANSSAVRCSVASALAHYIRLHGARAGLALNPSTPVDDAVTVCKSGAVDLVLIMTVEPGWGGQAFLGDKVLPKIRALRQACPWIDIQVDGGINAETARLVVEAGANVLVAGSSVFGRRSQDSSRPYGDAVRALTDALEQVGGLPLAPVPTYPPPHYEWVGGALQHVDASTRTKQVLDNTQSEALGPLVLQPWPHKVGDAAGAAHHFVVQGGRLVLVDSQGGTTPAPEGLHLRLVPIPSVLREQDRPQAEPEQQQARKRQRP